MNKILYIILVLSFSVFIACKNDANSPNTDKQTTQQQTKPDAEKRVIKAQRVITKEETDNNKKKAKDKQDKRLSDEREVLYQKNLKIREEYNSKEKKDNSNELIDMGNGVKIGKHYDFASYDLPNACELISDKWISNAFSTNVVDIEIKDASSPRTKYARSCFFKWDVDAVANGGIMLQVQGNPVPNETVTYISDFIINKRKEGETTMDNPDVRSTYKDVEGMGVEAVYNHNLNRCYWRIGDEYLFMLAFNLGMSEQDQKDIAVKIGKEVLKNFKRINR